MYSQERMMNFRWISRIMATYSKHTLTHADLVPVELSLELSELGQFAEMTYSTLPIEYIFDNLELLLRTDFPLEGYQALQESVLVSAIHGRVAHLKAYVAYRRNTKQLLVAISGTANMTQAMYDLRILKHWHKAASGCAVHTGFWKMYKGIRPEVLNAIQKGLAEHDVCELVIVGHSMGQSHSTVKLIQCSLVNSLRRRSVSYALHRPFDDQGATVAFRIAIEARHLWIS